MESRDSVRILHVISALGLTGPGRTLTNFVCESAARYHHNVLVIKRAHPAMVEQLNRVGCECIVLGQNTLLVTPRTLITTLGLIKRFEPNVLQFSECAPIECPMRVLVHVFCRHISIVSLIQTKAADYYAAVSKRLLFRLVRVGESWTRRHVARFVTNAAHLRDHMIQTEGVRAERIALIPNAIDVRHFVWAGHLASLGRRQFQFSASDLVVGCVASITPPKNHLTLLRAFEMVHRRMPNARLLLVGNGEGSYAASVQRAAGEWCTFAGQQVDVRPAVAAMDVFVLSSVVEGCPTALLEAMALSRACIVTDIPAMREIIRSGVEGLVVPAGRSEDMADAMCRLLSDSEQRAALGRAARERVVQSFSLAESVQGFADLYSKLAAQRAAHMGNR